MQAILIEDFNKPPSWKTFRDPVAGPGQELVRVSAAALSNLAKGQASGTHYSSTAELPFVPGADGVGRLEDGTRVYFFTNDKPFGPMAELSLVRPKYTVTIPDELDDTLAAALANPAMSSWAALTYRAKIQPGDHVLINGATGSAGKLAIQIAKHLGAKKIIATGRDPVALEQCKKMGADEIISLKQTTPDLTQTFRTAIHQNKISIILDYLWGSSAEALINAIGGPGALHSDRPIDYVQIGAISGPDIPLPAAALRSTGLRIMGSGLGSVSYPDLLASIRAAFSVAVAEHFQVDFVAVPMSEVATAWNQDYGGKRLVFVS